MVNDATRRRIPQLTLLVFHEKSLIDPFVNDNDCDLGLDSGLVVDLIDRVFELRDFRGENLVAHCVADAITI